MKGMRHEADYFGDQELVLIYIAKRLKEALALEKVLDAGGMDYSVVTGKYASGILFRSERVGAFFYVAAPAEQTACSLIHQHGFKPHDGKR